MDREAVKRERYLLALARTKEALAEYEQTHSPVVRDGAIQRFEFTSELAWKACRERLLADGFTGIDSPKSAMRTAYAAHLVDDEQGWLNLLQACNLTSHLYDEAQMDAIFESIKGEYMPLFEQLAQAL